MKKLLTEIMLGLFCCGYPCEMQAMDIQKENYQHSFTATEGTFKLDGKPFIVKAAELHYPRIPKPYWDNRIKLCKALGMNTVASTSFGMYTSRSLISLTLTDRTTCAHLSCCARRTT